MANSHFPSGGDGTPGGSANSVQYNDNGAFGGFGSWDGAALAVDAVAVTGEASADTVAATTVEATTVEATAVVAGSVRGTAVAFGSLPAVPVEGMLVAVTDSSTATWGATITGSGANHVLAYYNGTNWTVAGA